MTLKKYNVYLPTNGRKEQVSSLSSTTVPEIGNTNDIKLIEKKEPNLVRVIDNINSSKQNDNNNTEKILETEEQEIKSEDLVTTQEKVSDEHNELNNVSNEDLNVIEDNESDKIKKPILKKVEEKLTETTGWEPDKEVKFLGVFSFRNRSEKIVFLAFVIPPLLISVISMIHVVSFFELSNAVWLSWALAAAFEFASISALFALTALTKIKRNTIWILFFAIVIMQVIGNMYHSYVHMDPANVDLLKMLTIVGINAKALPWTLRILGFLQGGILPLISLSFVKAIVEYLNVNKK